MLAYHLYTLSKPSQPQLLRYLVINGLQKYCFFLIGQNFFLFFVFLWVLPAVFRNFAAVK